MKSKNQVSRRTFVKKSLVGSTAALLPWNDLIANSLFQKSKSKLRLGLVTYLWAKDWDLPTIIANCEKSGVLGVELRSTHAHGVEIDISTKRRKEILAMFNDSSVSFVGPGSAEEYNHPDPAQLKKAIEDTKKFIKLSYDCGGTGVKVRPNKLYDDIPHEKTIEQIGRSLNEVGIYAADFNQEIRVEVHGSGTSNVPVMKKIFDYVTQKNVGMCWNCNEQDLEGAGFQSNFDLVKDRLATTTHIRELNIGDYPYQQLFDNMVKMDYRGWILLECRTDPADKVVAMAEQKMIFDEMIEKALK